MRFDLRILHSREMADIADSDAISSTQRFKGEPVITVTKRTVNPEKILMGVSPIARDPDGIHLRCFLYLAVQVGSNDDGGEAHALLRLDTLA
jgi:hypothetical protein